MPPPKWYDVRHPLGVPEDKYYLSELQCVLRMEFVEAFGTDQVRSMFDGLWKGEGNDLECICEVLVKCLMSTDACA